MINKLKKGTSNTLDGKIVQILKAFSFLIPKIAQSRLGLDVAWAQFTKETSS